MLDIFASDLRPMRFWSMTVDEKIAQWRTGQPEGRSTGFKHLDVYLRLINSEFTLIAARPSMGKTSLAMQIADNVAQEMTATGEQGTVAVFSAEMSGTELMIRMSSALSGVNAHKLRLGKGSPAEYDQFQEAARRLRNLPIWIDDGARPTTQLMLERLSLLNEDIPVKLMVFDFLELGGDSSNKEDVRLSTIAQNLKGIAKKLDIPVIGLSQLSREVESRANKMPQLSDLRYSGMLEQIADKVLFLVRPEYYLERQMGMSDVPVEDEKGVAYALLAKNRNGPVGMVKLAFLKDRAMFATLERERIDLNK